MTLAPPMNKCLILAIVAGFASAVAYAQGLPPPSRDVFRCEHNGQVSYSDQPCLAAKKVDVEPTRGLNKSTGKERVGADVQRERFNEGVAEALRPITGGKDAKQMSTDARRFKLPLDAQRECRRLDQTIPDAEQREASAADETRLPIQRALLAQRQRFIALGC